MIFFKNIIIIIALLFSLLFFTKRNYNIDNNDSYFKIEIHKVKNGYGYSLSSYDKILIKQDFIPAIQKKHPFCTFEDAYNVATLVKERFVKNQNPKIILIDLENLNVSINCVDLP